MQDKGQPLGGRQVVEDDEQGRAQGIGQEQLGFGLGPAGGFHSYLGPLVAQRFVGPGPAAPQYVQAQAGYDSRQPTRQIGDTVGPGPAEPKPRLLDNVVGFRPGTSIRDATARSWPRLVSNR